MNQEFKYSIIEMLKNRGAYSVSTNGKQHYTRCPYCGDSRNINHAHMSIKKAMRYGKLTNNDKEKFSVPLYTDSSINARKLEYLNNRLGIDYTYTDARDNKLVLNLFDFIMHKDNCSFSAAVSTVSKIVGYTGRNGIGISSTPR